LIECVECVQSACVVGVECRDELCVFAAYM
jgi:hypothetical protein